MPNIRRPMVPLSVVILLIGGAYSASVSDPVVSISIVDSVVRPSLFQINFGPEAGTAVVGSSPLTTIPDASLKAFDAAVLSPNLVLYLWNSSSLYAIPLKDVKSTVSWTGPPFEAVGIYLYQDILWMVGYVTGGPVELSLMSWNTLSHAFNMEHTFTGLRLAPGGNCDMDDFAVIRCMMLDISSVLQLVIVDLTTFPITEGTLPLDTMVTSIFHFNGDMWALINSPTETYYGLLDFSTAPVMVTTPFVTHVPLTGAKAVFSTLGQYIYVSGIDSTGKAAACVVETYGTVPVAGCALTNDRSLTLVRQINPPAYLDAINGTGDGWHWGYGKVTLGAAAWAIQTEAMQVTFARASSRYRAPAVQFDNQPNLHTITYPMILFWNTWGTYDIRIGWVGGSSLLDYKYGSFCYRGTGGALDNLVGLQSDASGVQPIISVPSHPFETTEWGGEGANYIEETPTLQMFGNNALSTSVTAYDPLGVAVFMTDTAPADNQLVYAELKNWTVTPLFAMSALSTASIELMQYDANGTALYGVYNAAPTWQLFKLDMSTFNKALLPIYYAFNVDAIVPKAMTVDEISHRLFVLAGNATVNYVFALDVSSASTATLIWQANVPLSLFKIVYQPITNGLVGFATAADGLLLGDLRLSSDLKSLTFDSTTSARMPSSTVGPNAWWSSHSGKIFFTAKYGACFESNPSCPGFYQPCSNPGTFSPNDSYLVAYDVLGQYHVSYNVGPKSDFVYISHIRVAVLKDPTPPSVCMSDLREFGTTLPLTGNMTFSNDSYVVVTSNMSVQFHADLETCRVNYSYHNLFPEFEISYDVPYHNFGNNIGYQPTLAGNVGYLPGLDKTLGNTGPMIQYPPIPPPVLYKIQDNLDLIDYWDVTYSPIGSDFRFTTILTAPSLHNWTYDFCTTSPTPSSSISPTSSVTTSPTETATPSASGSATTTLSPSPIWCAPGWYDPPTCEWKCLPGSTEGHCIRNKPPNCRVTRCMFDQWQEFGQVCWCMTAADGQVEADCRSQYFEPWVDESTPDNVFDWQVLRSQLDII